MLRPRPKPQHVPRPRNANRSSLRRHQCAAGAEILDGTTCTNLNKGLGTRDLEDEGVCGEALPAVCKDCRFGGDGCSR